MTSFNRLIVHLHRRLALNLHRYFDTVYDNPSKDSSIKFVTIKKHLLKKS